MFIVLNNLYQVPYHKIRENKKHFNHWCIVRSVVAVLKVKTNFNTWCLLYFADAFHIQHEILTTWKLASGFLHYTSRWDNLPPLLKESVKISTFV